MKDSITELCFDDYLKSELDKPVNNDTYDPEGNSDRAVVTRGLFREILWQYKVFPKRIIAELKLFDGLSTELGWFVQLPVMILFSPILPIFAGKHRHNRSLSKYKAQYERYLNKLY